MKYLKYLLILFIVTVFFTGCIFYKKYPSNWHTFNKEECLNLTGYYTNINQLNDYYSLSSLFFSNEDNQRIYRDIKKIYLLHQKNYLKVEALGKKDNILKSLKVNIALSCNEGLRSIEYPNEENGIFKDGVIGYSSEKMSITKDMSDNLIIKFEGTSVGAYGPIPFAVAGRKWYRYKKIKLKGEK